MTFPNDFLWGAATASYQIEGSDLVDGRGECIWYRFSHTPGKVDNGDTGDIACDHYHRYQEDVALMKQLGLNAYRFSIAWARVLPLGTGKSNPEGLDFYERLVDELLQANITPFVTLYHWDLPQRLQDKGGWAVPESVDWFAEYTNLMTQKLGDRIKYWATFNEPWVSAFVGHYEGRHAPGIKELPTAFKAAHHLLLSHGAAIPVIRQNVADAQTGIVLNVSHFEPATDTEQDRKAARLGDGWMNRWFFDPIYKGQYPVDIVEALGDTLTGIKLDAVKAAAVPIDFVGINYYYRTIKAWDNNKPPFFGRDVKPEGQYTEMNWEVYAPSLTPFLVRIQRDYAPKAMYITENGASFPDVVKDGTVHDPDRVNYLKTHIAAAEEAINQGAALKGYFVWSLLDNFEWGYGYSKRFGIIYVNFDTLERIPKSSYRWYQDFLKVQMPVT